MLPPGVRVNPGPISTNLTAGFMKSPQTSLKYKQILGQSKYIALSAVLINKEKACHVHLAVSAMEKKMER